MRRRLKVAASILAALAALLLWVSTREEEATVEALPAAVPVVPRNARRPVDRVEPGALATTARQADDVTSAVLLGNVDTSAAPLAGFPGADGGDSAAVRAAMEAWLARNAALAEKHVDAFCELSKRLAKTPGLEPPTRERDAAPFLAGRADWEDGHTGLLHLPASLTDRMRQPAGAWKRFGADDLAGLDFTWMKELLAFDHWTLMRMGPLRDSRDAPAFEQVLPSFVTMQQWAKLRLVKGLVEHDLVQASLEVRHLAKICGSTSTLLGDMNRLLLLTLEREFFEGQGLPPPEGALTAQTHQDARAAGFAAHNFLLTGVPLAVKKKALGCSPTRCSAMVEAAALMSGLRGVTPGAGEDLAWLQQQQPCEPALLDRVASSPPLSKTPSSDQLLNSGLERVLRDMVDGGTF